MLRGVSWKKILWVLSTSCGLTKLHCLLVSKYCVLYLHPNVLVLVVFGVAFHLRVIKVHNTEVG